MWGEKPQRIVPGINPHSQVVTAKPNPHTCSVPDGIRTKVPEVEGEARHHYTNLTAAYYCAHALNYVNN